MYGGKKLRQKRREARIYFNAQPAVCAEYFDIKKIAEIKKYFFIVHALERELPSEK